MKWDINTLGDMDDAQLMEVLREMQAESESLEDDRAERDEANDYVRAKLATIRRNVRQFQARHGAEAASSDDPAGDDPPAPTDPSHGAAMI
jgi:hypothetical protein